jgi:hypothetical protein
MAWAATVGRGRGVEEHLTLARRHLRGPGRGHLAKHLLHLDAAHTRHSLPENGRQRIAAAMNMGPAAIARRWERAWLWEEALARFSEELPATAAELSVPWRLAPHLHRPERSDPLVARLRAAGFDAGSNFPSPAKGFATYCRSSSMRNVGGRR